jgi:hypothetical protein
VAAQPPFKRTGEGSSPSAGTIFPRFVQRQDTRPITGESGFESLSVDQVRTHALVSVERCASPPLS